MNLSKLFDELYIKKASKQASQIYDRQHDIRNIQELKDGGNFSQLIISLLSSPLILGF
jgi:hypothetical protein